MSLSEEFLRDPAAKGIRIVVYGSLKRGGKLHGHMQGSRFLGTTTFPGQLFSLGSYPAARPAEEPEDLIHGEVYECSDALVELLDRIEGHPWMYKRSPIQTAHFGQVQAYIYQRRPSSLERRIASGVYNVEDWK